VVTGCSRLGKAALLAAARDERFAVCVPNQTGKGGVPLNKRFYGDNVRTETQMFPHWFCKAYRKYIDNEKAMPFDQHLLLAAVAPRPLLVQGYNRTWFDPKGEYLACQAASPVWMFLGKPGLPGGGEPADFSRAAIGPYLGYVRRPGQHGISGWDWKWLLDFADRALADRAVPVKLVPAPQRLVRKEGMFRSATANPPIAESRDASLPPEGYRLSVTPDGISVKSADDAGAFYARQTLFQLADVLIPVKFINQLHIAPHSLFSDSTVPGYCSVSPRLPSYRSRYTDVISFHTRDPTTPDSGRPKVRWNARTAFSVEGP